MSASTSKFPREVLRKVYRRSLGARKHYWQYEPHSCAFQFYKPKRQHQLAAVFPMMCP